MSLLTSLPTVKCHYCRAKDVYSKVVESFLNFITDFFTKPILMRNSKMGEATLILITLNFVSRDVGFENSDMASDFLVLEVSNFERLLPHKFFVLHVSISSLCCSLNFLAGLRISALYNIGCTLHMFQT